MEGFPSVLFFMECPWVFREDISKCKKLSEWKELTIIKEMITNPVALLLKAAFTEPCLVSARFPWSLSWCSGHRGPSIPRASVPRGEHVTVIKLSPLPVTALQEAGMGPRYPHVTGIPQVAQLQVDQGGHWHCEKPLEQKPGDLALWFSFLEISDANFIRNFFS